MIERAFTILSEAWYADPTLSVVEYTDEIMFGMYNNDGGTQGEIAIRWIPLGLRRDGIQLQAFDDSWAVLALFADVIAEMGDLNDQNITPTQFAALLKERGFKDKTPRENPYTQ